MIIACALVGLGALAAVVAILLPVYAVPHLRKIPLDIAADLVSEAPGSKLVDSQATAAGHARTETNVPLRFRVDVTTEDPSDAQHVTLQAATSMTRSDLPDTQPFISANVDRVTLDRVTAMPVTDIPSEVAEVTTRPPDPTPNRDGFQYKFPFDVQRQHSYPYYDITSRTTHPLDYVDDSRVVDGMRLFHFHQDVPAIDLRPGQPEARLTLSAAAWGLPGDPAQQVTFDLYYSVERDVWVEPTTGSIVAVQEHLHRFLGRSADDPHALVTLDAHTKFDDATIAQTSALAHDGRMKLLWAGRYAPIMLGVVAVILIAGGIALGIRAGRSGSSEARPASES